MRARHLFGIIALQTLFDIYCSSSWAFEPTKPIQQCEQEFQTRQTQLRAAGVSAASFFHECWWHSRAGLPTEVSSENAQTRISKVQRDPAAETLWTGKRAVAQRATPKAVSRVANKTSANKTSANKRVRMAASDRRTRRKEARLQRRIASRARHLVLASRTDRSDRTRVAAADLGRQPIKKQRVSSRHVGRREPYDEQQVQRAATQMSVEIPANAVEGRRSWIGTTSASGPIQVPAVIIGPLRAAATKGEALHCWNQDVLFESGTAGWRQSLVCDGRAQVGAQKIWFEQYNARL